MKRDWEEQELDAMERLALSAADRARWDSLDTRRLLPTRAARRFAGLRRMLMQDDPIAGYRVDAGEAFRVPFRQDADESVMRKAAEAARAGAAGAKPDVTPPSQSPQKAESAVASASEPSAPKAESETAPDDPKPLPESPLARMMRRRRRRLFRHRM